MNQNGHIDPFQTKAKSTKIALVDLPLVRLRYHQLYTAQLHGFVYCVLRKRLYVSHKNKYKVLIAGAEIQFIWCFISSRIREMKFGLYNHLIIDNR